MNFLYFFILLFSFIIPFAYSFEKKMHFIKYRKAVFFSILIVAFFFIIWDVIFTKIGVWGFNPLYTTGVNFLKLPIEEWLFFIFIPYASLFIHYALIYFFPKLIINNKFSLLLSVTLIFLNIALIFFNLNKLYTLVNFIVFIFTIILGIFIGRNYLSRFYTSFLFILIPFIIVNGTLTGAFTKEPVVWYNINEIIGIRFLTIPLEDFAYSFSLLFLNLLFIEYFKLKFYKPN